MKKVENYAHVPGNCALQVNPVRYTEQASIYIVHVQLKEKDGIILILFHFSISILNLKM